MASTLPNPRQAIWRGLRRLCPQCGGGALFRSWFTMHRACGRCGLEFEGKPGDLWGFWVVTDRIFLFAAMIALYFGFTPESWWLRGAFMAAVVAALIATMPNRQGAFVALDYLARIRQGPLS